MDAFNPWDLVKAILRGFRWLVVGRHKREQDISYRTGGAGTTLDSTYSITIDPALKGSKGRKANRYQPLDGSDDEQLLAHAQSNPVAPVHAEPGDAGDISSANRYNEGPDHLRTMHPTPGTLRRAEHEHEQQTGVIPASLGADTGYHGARPAGQGNTLGRGGEHWNVWDGAQGTQQGFDRQNRF